MTGPSSLLNMRMARGTQARMGIGRRVSKTGNVNSLNLMYQPMIRPSGTPSASENEKAMRTRRVLTQMWE
jgi:hypothetical protein